MKTLGHRFRSWLGRRRRAGRSPSAALLCDLPLQLLRRGAAAVLGTLNRRLITPLADRAYGLRLREICGRSDSAPYFVVIVPFTLHHVLPAVALARRHVPVVLVNNGLGAFEERALLERFPDLPTLPLRSAARSVLPHGQVIDILLRHASRSLVLIDPDLFVFDPQVFDRLRPSGGEVAVGAFGFTNPRSKLTFPTTHLLALDAAALRSVMARHRVRPVIYWSTPRHLTGPLASMGLGDDNFVKDYLPYYDPLNLVLAMALHDGLEFRVLDASDDQVFHVGGVSYLDDSAYLDYFNLRLLELPWARPFAERYRSRLTGSLSVERARTRLVAQRSATLVERVDGVIGRLEREVALAFQPADGRPRS